ncbi:hypothetical protein NW768_011335 [Fusarium equiseti]|uniref:HAT C-terminal dimerisation domain-containing protein n=1 Tax=Fusarium equiseti TaxID=61235 RepID=A0ABQ8QY51_FUSEQ|nr:hypothetical protein NW768_011335 [Fusarium equiseti]
MERKLFSMVIIRNSSHGSELFAKANLSHPNKGNMAGQRLKKKAKMIRYQPQLQSREELEAGKSRRPSHDHLAPAPTAMASKNIFDIILTPEDICLDHVEWPKCVPSPPPTLAPLLPVLEATVILFKHPGSYCNTILDSQAASDEQFGATVIEGTDKYAQTPHNVPDDEGSDASSGSMEVDPVNARTDHSQSQADLDKQCDGTDTEVSSNGATRWKAFLMETITLTRTWTSIQVKTKRIHITRRLLRINQKKPATFHLLKTKNSYYDNIERICCTKWATQLSAEVNLPDWMTGGLQEMCIFKLIKTSWHQSFNRFAWIVEKEIQGKDMSYHSHDNVRLGHIFSLACKVIMNIEETREFWQENSIFPVEACRKMLDYFKAPGEVEDHLLLTPAEIWGAFAEEFELTINDVKEGKDTDKETMARMTAWENGVEQSAEGGDPLSEEIIFDEDEDEEEDPNINEDAQLI